MNESLVSTEEAAKQILEGSHLDQALLKAKEARRKYPENSFALLIEALAFDQQGSPKAIQTFQDYLRQSDHHTRFESRFLNAINFHEMRRGILKYLDSKGIKTEMIKSKSIFDGEWNHLFQSPVSKYLYWVMMILLGGNLIFFLYGIGRKIWERYQPLEKGYKRCNQCGALLSTLMLECTQCKYKV